MINTDDTRTSFAGAFRAMAADLAGAADGISEDGDYGQERVAIRDAARQLRDIAHALDLFDADTPSDHEEMALTLKLLAQMVRDRDRALADHWDWHVLPDREVGRMSPDADELLVRVETLILCPECRVGVPRSEATGHICWHQK